MRAALIVLILMTAPSGALADDSPPPARFLRNYTEGTLYLQALPPEKVRNACIALFTKHRPEWLGSQIGEEQFGCAVPHRDPKGADYSWCWIIYDGYEDTYLHELAHCNGWSEKHER